MATNLEKFVKKWKSGVGPGTHSWSNEAISQQIMELAKAINEDLINKPVETTKEQPKIEKGLHFDQEELKALYHLLNKTKSRKYMDELDVFLERIAFSLNG